MFQRLLAASGNSSEFQVLWKQGNPSVDPKHVVQICFQLFQKDHLQKGLWFLPRIFPLLDFLQWHPTCSQMLFLSVIAHATQVRCHLYHISLADDITAHIIKLSLKKYCFEINVKQIPPSIACHLTTQPKSWSCGSRGICLLIFPPFVLETSQYPSCLCLENAGFTFQVFCFSKLFVISSYFPSWSFFSCKGSSFCSHSCCFCAGRFQHISSSTVNSFRNFNLYVTEVIGHLIEVQWSLYTRHSGQMAYVLLISIFCCNKKRFGCCGILVCFRRHVQNSSSLRT